MAPSKSHPASDYRLPVEPSPSTPSQTHKERPPASQIFFSNDLVLRQIAGYLSDHVAIWEWPTSIEYLGPFMTCRQVHHRGALRAFAMVSRSIHNSLASFILTEVDIAQDETSAQRILQLSISHSARYVKRLMFKLT